MEPVKSTWWNRRIVIGLLVLAAALFFLVLYRGCEFSGKFRSVHPLRGEIVEAVYGLGTIKSERVFDLSVPVPAVLENIYVKEGMPVIRNQPLVRMLYRSTVYAPFDGVISHLKLHEGEIASSREPILTLIDLKARYVLVSLEQRDALRVQLNQKAFLTFEDDSLQRFEGKVIALYPHGDEFLAKVDVPGLWDDILPGMTLNVSIEIGRKQNALLVPAEAVDKSELLMLRDGKRKTIPVSTGLGDQDMVEIVSGDLKPSDQVLIPNK